jgi:hypothetical protein
LAAWCWPSFFSPRTPGVKRTKLFSPWLWNHFAEWAAAWCSVKIVLLGIGVLVMLDALGSLMIRMNNDVLGIGLLCLGVLPVLLSMFGFFELVKALL